MNDEWHVELFWKSGKLKSFCQVYDGADIPSEWPNLLNSFLAKIRNMTKCCLDELKTLRWHTSDPAEARV